MVYQCKFSPSSKCKLTKAGVETQSGKSGRSTQAVWLESDGPDELLLWSSRVIDVLSCSLSPVLVQRSDSWSQSLSLLLSSPLRSDWAEEDSSWPSLSSVNTQSARTVLPEAHQLITGQRTPCWITGFDSLQYAPLTGTHWQKLQILSVLCSFWVYPHTTRGCGVTSEEWVAAPYDWKVQHFTWSSIWSHQSGLSRFNSRAISQNLNVKLWLTVLLLLKSMGW